MSMYPTKEENNDKNLLTRLDYPRKWRHYVPEISVSITEISCQTARYAVNLVSK